MPASIRLYGLPVGVLDVAKDGDLSFRYEQGWLERTQLPHHPLSLALPLSPYPYDHDHAGPFFDGLLPDAQQTRESLARYLQVDATTTRCSTSSAATARARSPSCLSTTR
jgi:serine/threonine-protein kinase HipA